MSRKDNLCFLVFFGYPCWLKSDQVSVFTCKSWMRLTNVDQIQLRLFKVEYHYSREPEHFQNPLMELYRKRRYTHSSATQKFILTKAFEEMKNVAEECKHLLFCLVREATTKVLAIGTHLVANKKPHHSYLSPASIPFCGSPTYSTSLL